MIDIFVGVIIVVTFVFATVVSRWRISILLAGAVTSVLLVIPKVSIQTVSEYVRFPQLLSVLILVFALELFAIVSSRTNLIIFWAHKLFRSQELSISKRGRVKIFVALIAVTFLLSMLMNNLAAIIVVIPLSLRLGTMLRMDVERLIVLEVIASNLGGASALIGDFPNMIIASYTGISFVDFLVNLGLPILFVLLPVTLLYCWISNRKKQTTVDSLEISLGVTIIELQPNQQVLWKKAGPMLVLFALMILLFLLFPTQEPWFIAATCALPLIIINGESIISEVNLGTLIIFTCLFVLAGVMESTDAFAFVRRNLLLIPPQLALFLFMWIVALFTAVFSAGPTTASFLLIADQLNSTVPHNLAWWALSLGVLAGSSATVLGATAGPVAAGLYDSFHRRLSSSSQVVRRFSFLRFIKLAAPLSVAFFLFSNLYLLIRILLDL